MMQAIVKLKHSVTSVRRDAVASLRRHNDGPGLPSADSEPTASLETERLSQAFDKLATQCELWNQAIGQRLQESRELAIEISIAVAERLLHDEIHCQRHAVEKLVDAAFAASGNRNHAMIRVSPTDAQRLQTLSANGKWNPPDKVQVTADPRLAVGNIEADLPGYSLVFNWRKELETIKQNILNELDDAES
jgi:hypothetical protein